MNIYLIISTVMFLLSLGFLFTSKSVLLLFIFLFSLSNFIIAGAFRLLIKRQTQREYISQQKENLFGRGINDFSSIEATNPKKDVVIFLFVLIFSIIAFFSLIGVFINILK